MMETQTTDSNKYTQNYDALKLKMTIEATNLIAAEIISNKNFPQKNTLPKFYPLPFNNFGHFFLFDHRRFVTIIYQTIRELKEIASLGKRNYIPWIWAGTSFIVLLLILLLARTEEQPSAIYLVPIITSVVAYFIALTFGDDKINTQLADHKATILEQLLSNEWQENKGFTLPERLEKSCSACTNGILANNEIPVLVMVDDLGLDDQQPFPGFGRLQLDNKFICPPKKFDSIINKNESQLLDAVISKLQKSLINSGIKNIGFKKAVIINSETISIDSPWLDDEKKPVLSINTNHSEISLLDNNASVRVYIIVEVLFPKYDSAACFFIRPFMAENSAGWHLAITTIGPPEKRKPYFSNKIWKYKMGKNKDIPTSPGSQTYSQEPSENITILNQLQSKRFEHETFHEKISLSLLRNLDPLEEKNYDESFFDKRTKEIIENEIHWPGKYYYVKYNIRERKSLTFGGDFFGYPELTSSILTVYDQISRNILEAIEEEGFDISKYKDKDGKFSINAESIDKIIVGEIINVRPDKEKETPPKQNIMNIINS